MIPLCHPLRLTGIEVEFQFLESGIAIRVEVNARDRTGVEMEALTAASVAALTIYDMAKSEDKGMVIQEVVLDEKRGGDAGRRRRAAARDKRLVSSATTHMLNPFLTNGSSLSLPTNTSCLPSASIGIG